MCIRDRLSIGESGTLLVGNRSSLHPGNFQLTLNSSLLPQLPYHDAVSTLDVHGTLKVWSADLEMEDGPVRSWKAGQFSEDAFILEMDEDPVEFSSGTLLGLVSSHGLERASVMDFEKSSGKVKLQKKLQTNHGKNAIVYKLSRSMKIKAAGSAVLRVWNGLHHAGGGLTRWHLLTNTGTAGGFRTIFAQVVLRCLLHTALGSPHGAAVERFWGILLQMHRRGCPTRDTATHTSTAPPSIQMTPELTWSCMGWRLTAWGLSMHPAPRQLWKLWTMHALCDGPTTGSM